ncbi:MAG TPA: suppressor of fused domain protein [Kofleriaceae bacterium]
MGLELSVLREADDDAGYVAAFAETDQMLLAVGGQSNDLPTVLVTANGRQFELVASPKKLGLRDALAVGDAIWVCGEYGQLAATRDHGRTWKLFETDTQECLFKLALAPDGAVWTVGDRGYAARVRGDAALRVDLKTEARLSAVYAIRDEIVVLGDDGKIRRWQDGEVREIATGSTKPLTALVVAKSAWIVIGDGGFVARSPDGQWYSRIKVPAEVDLEGIAMIRDGRLVMIGDRGTVMLSSDDGRSWEPFATNLPLVHLWSIERFGAGVLIGGDDGLVLRLAPPDDAHWAERMTVVPAALDAVFAAGPVGFIERGLAAFIDARAVDKTAELAAGPPAHFADEYGMPLPPEVAAFFRATAGRDAASTFDELRLKSERSDVGDKNLFELLVLRNQHAVLGTDLVEAFAGAFAIGTQRDGDTYLFEIYEWEDGHGQRQVLCFDPETSSVSTVIADSLDSLVYRAALHTASEEKRISRQTYEAGLRKLDGRVAPSYEPRRRDTEFFIYRSQWIWALLGGTECEEIEDLFTSHFNQTVPADQLEARFDACEKFIPTALYAMWRAYLFDEPELDRYVQIGLRHAARLVRDAAKLIEELRAGRNMLGTITDVRAWLAEFRALDLDPRRTAAREAEAVEKAAANDAARERAHTELAAVPREQWNELAWQWIEHGEAQRALLERIDDGDAATTISSIDALIDIAESEREAAFAQIAAEMSPELEAILVGSLVRGDELVDVLGKKKDDTSATKVSDEDRGSPGWEAIDAALRPLYGDMKPAHVGTAIPYSLGGPDPLPGLSAYPRTEPVPHWHFVTYGFTELHEKESTEGDESGFGFELTLRLARRLDEDVPPIWALNFLQNLGRYVFGTGNRFAAGHKMGLNGPIELDSQTKITAICFADDPELGELESANGKARFVQIVGITDDEYKLIQEWSTTGLTEILAKKLPLLVTDLSRSSVLEDPVIARIAETRVAAEGSSEDLSFAGDMKLGDSAVSTDDGRIRIELGALYAAALPRAMRGRIRHGRTYELRGQDSVLRLEPASSVGYSRDGDLVTLQVTQNLAREIEAQLRDVHAGAYDFEAWPQLEIVIVPSFIKAQDGEIIDVKGVPDPARAKQLVDAENHKRADIDDDEDESTKDPERVIAAAKLTERALRLAPDDPDVQFTHAMLLLDADAAGLNGKIDDLLTRLPRFEAATRVNVAVRMGAGPHDRFSDAVDAVLAASITDVGQDLMASLRHAIARHAPDRAERFEALFRDAHPREEGN